ncbi:hypothetical protein B0H19DRAFT_1071559 [Mycena capillaripes]|nr:hypothetical protein B0H19DRAFT_1082926 [Mycena capillaripes]KAJ6556464.1 hypothetical protein B0H19DRAFT_1071559 [Mycena capillaripes]
MPHSENVRGLKRTEAGYIGRLLIFSWKLTWYLETNIVGETMAQFIKNLDFPVIVVETADRDTLDFSQLPIGALNMSVTGSPIYSHTRLADGGYETHATATRRRPFPAVNYGNVVAGLQHQTIPTPSMKEHLWRADHTDLGIWQPRLSPRAYRRKMIASSSPEDGHSAGPKS